MNKLESTLSWRKISLNENWIWSLSLLISACLTSPKWLKKMSSWVAKVTAVASFYLHAGCPTSQATKHTQLGHKVKLVCCCKVSHCHSPGQTILIEWIELWSKYFYIHSNCPLKIDWISNQSICKASCSRKSCLFYLQLPSRPANSSLICNSILR